MSVHLFPTHPRLSEPVPLPRGWLILGLFVGAWLAFAGLGYGVLRVVAS